MYEILIMLALIEGHIIVIIMKVGAVDYAELK